MGVGDCEEKGCWNGTGERNGCRGLWGKGSAEEGGAAGKGICVGDCRERVGRKGRGL